MFITKLPNLNYTRFLEKKNNINDLLFITKFLNKRVNTFIPIRATKIILNFSFKIIDFNKKRISPFLLLIELLTNQPSIVRKSNKIILRLGIKKNTFVGCKLNLRRKNLFNFFDNLLILLPRCELQSIFNIWYLNKNTKNHAITQLTNLTKYQPLTKIYEEYAKDILITIVFSTFFFEEKLFVLSANQLYVQQQNKLSK